MVTFAVAALLGLPIAVYLTKRKGVKPLAAIAFGALFVMVAMIVIGMVGSLIFQ